MTWLHILAICIVCATALSWHAISRHYARRDAAEGQALLASIADLRDSAADSAHVAASAATAAGEAADRATSTQATRDYNVAIARLHELEARIGMRRG